MSAVWTELNDDGFVSASSKVGIFCLEVCQQLSDQKWAWHFNEWTKGELWIATSGDTHYDTEEEAKRACEKCLLNDYLFPAVVTLLPTEEWAKQIDEGWAMLTRNVG